MNAIKAENLTYVYSPNTPFEKAAIQDINLEIEQGEFVGVIGHTGSGKSTLIQHFNGLLKPTSGRIFINGTDLWADGTDRRAYRFKVGLVFQYPEYQLFEETVYKDIAFGPTNMGLSPAEVEQRVREAAIAVGLKPHHMEKSPFELSGGQKRRVAIAGVDAMDYRPLASIPSEEDKSLKRVAEGAQIPSTQIRVQDHLVRLYKRGRVLVSSYEALRFERLDLFTVTLRQIGAWIARSQLNDAVKVLIEGDGNQNPAKVIPTAGADAITYDDLLGLWGEFQDYEMNRLVAAPDVMQKLLGIAEFRDPLTGLNFQGTGRLSTPMGAALYRAAGVPEGMLVALDKSCALEMVTAAEVSVEYDKLIDRQLERAAITSVAGFAKIFPDAVRVLKVKSGAGA